MDGFVGWGADGRGGIWSAGGKFASGRAGTGCGVGRLQRGMAV